MADVRPFRGLRYHSDAIGDLGAVLAPPYDVIDAEDESALRQRSPYNVIRLELPQDRPADGTPEDRYARAASILGDWRRSGVLAWEERPALYAYIQEFEQEGQRLRRTAVLCRVRLEPWETGVVRPHEETMAAPKEDRLQLLRHLRVNVSPVFALYRDPRGQIAALLSGAGAPLADATTPDGQRHVLRALTDEAAIEALSASFRDAPLYLADGHHRYETALAYRDERRAQASAWSGEEPENFVLAALTALDDPGLTLLPIHRLVRPPSRPADLLGRLERFFRVEDATPEGASGAALDALLSRLASAGASGTAPSLRSRTCFGALGLEKGRCHLLTLKDPTAARSLMPQRSPAWQALDANVLEYVVLRETLGVDDAAPALDYTEDAGRALREVESGRWPLAFLLNPTPVEQILAVADAGERMPRKSTFFQPKLATGLVLHSFD